MNRSKTLYSPVLKLRELVSAFDVLNSLGNNDVRFRECSDVPNCYKNKNHKQRLCK